MRTQDSRTDIPPRAGGGGARERRGILDPQSGRRQAIGPPAEPCVASAIRAGSQKEIRRGADRDLLVDRHDHRVHDEGRPISETGEAVVAVRHAVLLLQRARAVVRRVRALELLA